MSSKRSRAIEHVHHAEHHIREALSLLGGFTRTRVPRRDWETFVIRKVLEGLLLRTKTCIMLFTNKTERQKAVDVLLLSDFEREYDSTRRPGC